MVSTIIIITITQVIQYFSVQSDIMCHTCYVGHASVSQLIELREVFVWLATDRLKMKLLALLICSLHQITAFLTPSVLNELTG